MDDLVDRKLKESPPPPTMREMYDSLDKAVLKLSNVIVWFASLIALVGIPAKDLKAGRALSRSKKQKTKIGTWCGAVPGNVDPLEFFKWEWDTIKKDFHTQLNSVKFIFCVSLISLVFSVWYSKLAYIRYAGTPNEFILYLTSLSVIYLLNSVLLSIYYFGIYNEMRPTLDDTSESYDSMVDSYTISNTFNSEVFMLKTDVKCAIFRSFTLGFLIIILSI